MVDNMERIKKLKEYLVLIESILDVNDSWNKTQRSIAKYTFMQTLMHTTDEVVFQTCSMGNRDIVVELQSCITLLERKANENINSTTETNS